MVRLYTDTTIRECSRCGAELTDPASRECGVGPICRQKDNTLYARSIAANVPGAAAIFTAVDVEAFHEDAKTRFKKACSSFLEKSSSLQKHNDDMFQVKLTGADFRDEVRALDYCLSFNLPSKQRQYLIDIVRMLGYVGLAGVLDRTASRSKANIWFDSGWLYLTGTASRIGFSKMRKIPGAGVPRYRGDKTPYRVPAQHAQRFAEIVREHWPLYVGQIPTAYDAMDDIMEQALGWLENNPTSGIEKDNDALGDDTEAAPLISIRSSDFTLAFIWDRNLEMGKFLTALKSIPSKERSYEPDSKIWFFRKKHLDAVKKITAETFGNVRVVETTEVTNEAVWSKKPVKYARQPRRYYRRKW